MSDSIQGETVLITGGTGTFGNAFLDKCIEDGTKVVSHWWDSVSRLDSQYKSDLAPRMTKEQVLNLIRSVFEGGVH